MSFLEKSRRLLLLPVVVLITCMMECMGGGVESNLPPAAKCQTGFFYRTLPLTLNESYITNLDHLFNGYNLQYQLQDHQQLKDYITLADKLTLQTKQIPDNPLIGLKSYHVEKKGNGWGNNFVALTERNQLTLVHYGVINSNRSAPIVNNYVQVENSTMKTCFDAVMFKAQDLIVVDCVQKLPKPNSKGQVLQNYFQYVRISDGQKLFRKNTSMYLNFNQITRRSLVLYSDLQNAHTFLLRTYFHDSLAKPLNQNTFIEVFLINDPKDPWIVQIIDRSFLKSKTLQITDIKVYLGQIFILDTKMGLYRVMIGIEEDLKLAGYYQVKGFDRFNVFSNNFDDNFQLALANSHTALQIDWTNRQQPRLINKYSLMPDSKVSQIFLNQRFLFIQSFSQFNTTQYNYTWIFNRGDRTYTKAFKVMKHNSFQTFIDLNEDMSYLIVIDDEKLANYRIDDSNMVMNIKKKDEELADKVRTFKVVAVSRDEMEQKVVKKCQILINFTLLQQNNHTMWPIGDLPPSTFTANYPGKVQIKLHQYVFGPNITYKIRQVDHDLIKRAQVFQQEELKVQFQTGLPQDRGKMKFLLTQTVNYQSQNRDNMHIYLQDQHNITYFIVCQPQHIKPTVTCNFTHSQQFQGQINSWVTGFFLNRYTLQQNHIIAYTTTNAVNKVQLLDFTQNQKLQTLQLQKGFAGNATSIAITGKELYVVLKYVKTVKIYDLEECVDGMCDEKCQLDYKVMFKLGIKYFSPTEVHTSLHHPNIIFIKTSDQIIVIDYNAECRPKLLTVLNPVDSAQIPFSFSLNQNHLLIILPTLNTIKEYTLERISLGEIRLTKQYPRYGYVLDQKQAVVGVSDKGTCVYVTMANEEGDHQVFVYRTGWPAVASLYDVIDLVSTENILVDATGFQIDYVTAYTNSTLRLYRQYQQPLAQIFNPNISYSFYLDYSNPSSRSNLQQISVKIINLPTYIKVNPELNDIMNTKDLLYSGPNRVNEINDSQWWEGNVLTVYGDCDDCRGEDPTIKVLNHIQHQEQLKLVPGMSQFQWTQDGGVIQSMNSLVEMRHNGTVRSFVRLPFTEGTLCVTLAVGRRSEYKVSGCLSDGVVNLYLTSFLSQKGFAFEPFQTTAKSLFKLQAVNDLIVLVDTDANSYKKTRPGAIYIFGLNYDEEEPTSLIEVEVITGDDIGMEELGQLYINNAQITYHPVTDTYRLYFTEMTRGVFVIEFKYNDRSNSIVIKAVNWLKIEPLLTKLQYQLPYDASYQAITKMNSTYDQTLKKITEHLLLTTGKFHTIQLKVEYSLDGQKQLLVITRIYQRYAFYEIQNYIKYHNNLFVVSQILPDQFDILDRSKQLLTIYSTSQNRSFTDDPDEDHQAQQQKHDDRKGDNDDKVQERGFLGGFRINDQQLHYYDFNLTYNTEPDGHTEPRIGMLLIQYLTNRIQKFTLHQNLSVVTKQLVDTQIIYIDLKNDFSLQKIRILINGRSPFPEWKLITIILFSIIGSVLLCGGLFVGVQKLRGKMGSGSQSSIMNDSLLTTSDRKSFEPLTLRDSEEMYKDNTKVDKKKQKELQKQMKRKEKEDKEREKQRMREQKQQQKLRQKQEKERSRLERQSERQRQRERQSQSIRQKQEARQRQKQKRRQTERQRQRQRERQAERSQRQRFSESRRQRQATLTNNQPRAQYGQSSANQYSSSNRLQQQENMGSYSRFGERRGFRERPQRGARFNNEQQTGSRQPVRQRRNVAIIEE